MRHLRGRLLCRWVADPAVPASQSRSLYASERTDVTIHSYSRCVTVSIDGNEAISQASSDGKWSVRLAYMRDLRLFARSLGGIDLANITPATIDTVLTDPTVANTPDGLPKSPATMHRMKAVVKSFFSWALDTELIDTNPARLITMKRLSRTPPEYLIESEKRRLLKELHDRSNPLARRDRVIFEIFLGTGIDSRSW